MFRKILVGLEGSEASWCAVRRALSLSRDYGGEVWVVSVEEHLPRYAATIDEVQEEQDYENSYFEGIQAEARELAQRSQVNLHCKTLAGHAAQRIVEFARSGGFDLIVLGHRGHHNPWDRLAGSTADRVVDRAPCSVLIEHPPEGSTPRT
jgi:nucleotide-binding universal stress UspA family protein